MSLQKITKQLQKDLKKNPKKAGMLALLAVVAIWFWIPLFFGGDDKPKKPSLPAQPAAAAPSEQPATSASAAPTESPLSWREVEKLRHEDDRMRPVDVAEVANIGRSPFTVPPKYVALQKEQEEKQKAQEENRLAATKPVDLSLVPKSPQELGMTLASTLTSGDRRTATINNKIYRDGDTISAATGEEFKLIGVYPNHVVLERNATTYELAIKTTTGLKFGRVE